MSPLQDHPHPRAVAPPLHSSALSSAPSASESLNNEPTPLSSPVNVPHDTLSPQIGSAPSRFEERLSSKPTRLAIPGALYAVVPGVLFFVMGITARQSALPESFSLATSTRSSSFNPSSPLSEGNYAVLSAAQTLVVPQQRTGPSIVLRTRLQPSETVNGRAPIAGQITRVWVRAGQNVEVGDRVMRIASYRQSAAPIRNDAPPHYDQAAEDEQVKAVRAQSKLSQRLASAQARLKAAQTRVERAQTRVSAAMAIVQKLQSGATDEPLNEEVDEPVVKPREQAQDRALEARVQTAQSAAEKASAAADKAESAAAQAAREAARAEASAERKTRRAAGLRQTRERDLSKIAAATTAAPPADTPAGAAVDAATPKPVEKPSVPSVSINEIDIAEREARSATVTASSLRAQAEKLSVIAGKERARAQEAAASVAEALRSLRLFSDSSAEKSKVAKSPSRLRRASNLPSIEEAVRIVKSASDESRAANREAERWKDEVDEYSRQAKSTQQSIAASEHNLSTAQQEIQQRELDSVIQRNLSIVRAPSSGTVLRVSDVGNNVSFSDSIILIGKPGGLRAQFSDTSGLWRNLKEGSILSAVVTTRASASISEKLSPSSTRMNAENQGGNSPQSSSGKIPAAISPVNVPINARIESVEEPSSPGKPALVSAIVPSSVVLPRASEMESREPLANGAGSNGQPTNAVPKTSASLRRLRLRSGMTIELVLNESAAARVQFLPREAVVFLPADATDGNGTANDGTATNGAAANGTAVKSNASAASLGAATKKGLVAVLQPNAQGNYLVEWRSVAVRDDGAQTLTVSGLLPGERVALPAVRLHTLALSNDVETIVTLR